MEVLNVNGKSYVKASVLARQLGYTSDYIGQLCRGNKVDAKLVGRSWYVEKKSIESHKSTRYRSTQVKTVKAVQADLVELHTKQTTPVVGHCNFYAHSVRTVASRYEHDGSDLLPKLNEAEHKNKVLSIGLADAESVKIVSLTDQYIFDTPAQVAPVFSGALSITEYDDAELSVPEGGVLLHPTEVDHLKVHKKFTEKQDDLSAEQVVPTKTKISKVTTHVHVENSGADFFIASPILQVEPQVSKVHMVSIFFSTIGAVALVILFLSLEAHMLITKDVLTTTYVFKLDNLMASVYLSMQ